jgi:hypothetical protein
VVEFQYYRVGFSTIDARVFQKILVYEANVSLDSLPVPLSETLFLLRCAVSVDASVGDFATSLTLVLQAILSGTVALELRLVFLHFAPGAALHI